MDESIESGIVAGDEGGDKVEIVNTLISRVDAFLARGQGSPQRKTAVSRRKKTALANSSKGGKKRRMTEKEEDDIIMQDEMNQSEDIVPVVTRLEKQPANIKNGTMRDYQLEGLNWLISLRKAGISGILADEMGLGKTLQSISILAYLKLFQNVTGPHLVVVPLTTLGNWCNEFKKWCPSMKVFRFHGDKEERKAMLRDDLDPNNRKWEVVVTSYEMVIKHKTQLSRYNWEYIVVDEAHRLKNENSSLSKVMRMFTSVTRLLITGTPLQNNLHELWALLNFLLPNVFDNPDEFDALFQAGEDEEASIAQAKAMKQLHHLLRPFMLRRLKADVEKSLLPKKEVLVFVGMSELQKKLYLSIYHKNMDAVRGITVQKTALLNTIMQLRKCANHPYLFDGVEDRTLDVYGDHLYKVCGKLTVLDKLLTKLKARGSRVLIFSQMTRVLDILEDYCAIKKHAYCRIDGSTSTLDREAAMKTYNEPNSEKFCFLLSTRAGGLGINLYTADIVVLYDSDWNPQMDLQAQDRAHRIGQKKQVMVYRMVTEGTIEEKIIERAEIKLRLDAMVIQQGRMAPKMNMGNTDMLDMIRYGADAIFRSKESTITDDDIDLILARGEEKTADRNSKLQKHVGGQLKFNAPTFQLESEDPFKDDKSLDLALVSSLHDALGKRERKSRHSDLNEGLYYREALSTKAERSLLPYPKSVKSYGDWQFVNIPRLEELHEMETAFWDEHHASKEPPRLTLLPEAETKEQKTIIEAGFLNWKHGDYRCYYRVVERFGRVDLANICKYFLIERPQFTIEDVQRYHEVFWSQLDHIRGGDRLLKNIIKCENRLEKNAEMQTSLTAYVSPDMTRFNTINKLKMPPGGQNLNGKGYSKTADRFLLHSASKHGFGAWSQILADVHAAPELSWDFFMQSRNTLDVSRRVEALIKAYDRAQSKLKGAAAKAGNKRKTPTVSSKSSTAPAVAVVKKLKAASATAQVTEVTTATTAM